MEGRRQESQGHCSDSGGDGAGRQPRGAGVAGSQICEHVRWMGFTAAWLEGRERKEESGMISCLGN